MVLVRRRDHAERLACGPLRDRRVGERRSEQAFDARDALARERRATPHRSSRRPRRRPAASSRRAGPPPRTRRSSSDAADTPRARAASAGTRGRAGRAPAPSPAPRASSSTSRKRVSASNARGFRSCSVNRRSIASSPTSPTDSRYDSSRAPRCARTSDAPVTVPSSPLPWWSISSTWLSGSSRAPNRDFVRRIPFATAPTRPRSSVYRWRTRSASPNRIERRTTASVL